MDSDLPDLKHELNVSPFRTKALPDDFDPAFILQVLHQRLQDGAL